LFFAFVSSRALAALEEIWVNGGPRTREHREPTRSCESGRRNPVLATLLVLLLVRSGSAQVVEEPTQVPDEPDSTPAVPVPPPPGTVIQLAKDEAARYVSDSVALFRAPLHWKPSEWAKFGAVVVGVGGIMLFDRRLTEESQERRSRATDRLSSATTRFGTADSYVFAGTLVVSGLLFKNPNISSMGREAIEASVFSGLMADVVKFSLGRERPVASNNHTDFDVGSSNQSFPSGHATQAFTIASVVAARSNGWLIPTLAYTAATLVAYDRVNDRQHFPSDVVAGAALGIAVGRFVVHRHQAEEQRARALDLTIVPTAHGIQIGARF
jgi:hypothetical protein